MRQKLIDLLRDIERCIPPPENCHHCLTFAQYGSDVDGWKDKLCLQLNIAGKFQQFFLDDEDFDKPPFDLIYKILELLRTPDPAFQQGVGPGIYQVPWQPIETAPKDGTWILLFGHKQYGVGVWVFGKWAMGSICMFEGSTHWMPLPDPPSPSHQTQPEAKESDAK